MELSTYMDTNHPCSFRHHNLHFNSKGHKELRKAIRFRDEKSVQHLLENGTPVNGILGAGRTNFAFPTPLHLAVMSRDPKLVAILLDKGADVGAKNWHGETPLMVAAKLQDMKLMDLLLVHDLEDAADNGGFRHLHIACMRNRLDIVKKMVLINHGKYINEAVDKDALHWSGYTALHFSAHFESIEVVEFLVSCGANITSKDSRRFTPLHLADLVRNEIIIDMILAAHKLEFTNPSDIHGYSHFHVACTRDDVSVVEHFLKIGQDVDVEVKSSRWKGWKPMNFAIYYDCPNVMKLLLQYNSHFEAECLSQLLNDAFLLRDHTVQSLTQANQSQLTENCKKLEKLSTLHVTCIQNNGKDFKRVLSYKANVTDIVLDAPIWTGCTPLHLAVRYHSMDVIRLLLNHVTDIMMQNSEGKTPIHLAFERGYSTICSLIVEKIANVSNVIDKDGLSIFHILCTTGKLNLIESFIESGVDINARVGKESVLWSGFTPLHFACKFIKLEVVNLLLKNNVDISVPNVFNLDPFDLTVHKLRFVERTDLSQRCFEILMKIFLHAHEKSNKFDKKGITLLHTFCASRSNDIEILKQFLITHKHEINSRVKLPGTSVFNGCTPLHLALRFSNFEAATWLLKNGADPHLLNDAGDTPLEFAFFYDLLSVARSSIDSYKKIETLLNFEKPFEGLKPSHFHIACILGLTGVVKSVANISNEKLRMKFLNYYNDAGQTPLHSLILSGNKQTQQKQCKVDFQNEEILRTLLENGADVDARNCESQTPLDLLLRPDTNREFQSEEEQETDVEVMRILLQYGADVNLKNMFGETSLHKIYYSHRDPDRKDYFSSSSESDGCYDYTNYEICNKKLILALDHGADINIVDVFGQTCVTMVDQDAEYDRYNHLEDCVTTLRKHMKKLKVLGLPISEINEKAFESEQFNTFYCEEDNRFNDVTYVVQCERELELMRSSNIDRYTSLSEILYKSSHEMTLHCENEVLLETIESKDFIKKFPIYGNLLKVQVKRGQLRRRLLEKCELSLLTVMGILLPKECMDEVLQYLSDQDLRHVIVSAEKITG